ncbi:hypothetical protein [Brevundimonas sp.]|uniref:hypothetical protein n=1 Tax=Brevundimonas sp. TaxID=1871086 RepID=UPI0025BB05ED|nr:hypothetical protein [Brevundimonas sp.]
MRRHTIGCCPPPFDDVVFRPSNGGRFQISDWIFEAAATPQPTMWDDPALAPGSDWSGPTGADHGDAAPVFDGGKGELTEFDLMMFGAVDGAGGTDDDEATTIDDVISTGPRHDYDDPYDDWWETGGFPTGSTGDGPSGDENVGEGSANGGEDSTGPHVYTDTNRVGDTSCDADEAWQGLLRNAAPGQNGPASTGNIVNVPGLGPVVQTVNWETMTVTNTTMEGHLLHPGTVSRQVIGIGGDIYIETVGWGTGTLGAANTYFANDLWTAMDLLIAIYVDQNDDGEGDC